VKTKEKMTTTCIAPFSDGLYFDCNIWVPADEYRDLTSSSSGGDSEFTDTEESFGECPTEDNLSQASSDDNEYVEALNLTDVLQKKVIRFLIKCS
jgi:hypothetical protein